ncbi:hypothetical protein QBC35DRAFT_8836 [Podospora australis]|uniref:C2H2-type domain-containing protein n=1 Tax=Podospora australis TaxID=1536484 RepID=A0AAN7AQF4_9PEZI|nr:hypothetical protein QBC35DRAFT_8836 [Podospora australis]
MASWEIDATMQGEPATRSEDEEDDVDMEGSEDAEAETTGEVQVVADGMHRGTKRRAEDEVPAAPEPIGDPIVQAINTGGNVEYHHNNPRIPQFKPGLLDPNQRGENDCFFDACQTRAGNNQYFIRHLIDKHGLIRGDQGRQEGGSRKTPKYLTLCPSNWPFTHGSTSSCNVCGDISTLPQVVGDYTHESPAICSFCWTYFENRQGLVDHIHRGPCKSNEGFARKLTLIRHMFVVALRSPTAPEISQAAEGQRRAHIEAEKAARVEKYAQDQHLNEKAQAEWRAQTEAAARARRQGQARPSGSPARAAGAMPNIVPTATLPYANHQFAGAPGAPTNGVNGGTPGLMNNGVSPLPGSSVPAVDYAVPSATVEAMARTVERLSTIIGDLAATNSQLLQDIRLRDQQIVGRDQQIRTRDERINHLAAEKTKLTEKIKQLEAVIAEGGVRSDLDAE